MPSSNSVRTPDVHAAAVCVCATCRWEELLAHILSGGCCWISAAGECVCVCLYRWKELLANGFQSVQGAFDVTDLCGQGVYGLHGAVQLLTASHQRVHTLYTHVHRLSQAVY